MKSRAILFLATVSIAPGMAAAETVERIVAKVNGQIITLSQLEQEVRTTLERLGPAPTPEEEQSRLERIRPETLDRLI
ncbi:MAG TPA: hypothetical protein VJ921_10915, partial [Vicinamibacteria bacterium]|nr:hypothetical protein [Vicinamibacteria bacterium]